MALKFKLHPQLSEGTRYQVMLRVETKAYLDESTVEKLGRMAILLVDDATEEPHSKLTVNLPEAPKLAPGEFHVKTWGENEEVARAALASGLFVDTGRRVPTGFVEAHVWRFA